MMFHAFLEKKIEHWMGRLSESFMPFSAFGTIVRITGLTVEAVGLHAEIGDRCILSNHSGDLWSSEVVGFRDDRLLLTLLDDHIEGLGRGARVRLDPRGSTIEVGPGLLGRVVDALARPLDSGILSDCSDRWALQASSPDPMKRPLIHEGFHVGVRAVDTLLTLGKGQRVGLMAGSGVGKSVLLGMMTRYATADVVVVGLIGERGREVREFVEHALGPQGLARAVVVAVPADRSALMRLQGAYTATAIAEYFRAQGQNVLLLMDSLTRFAQAQREIGLASGEPPATKGYPPSVFSKIPKLLERAGVCGSTSGSITGIYTVLAEGDDQSDPIVDACRAVLDGHIVLSRALAEEGHFPAIDVEASISRVMPLVVTPDQMKLARRFRYFLSLWQQNRDLIQVGAYVSGQDADLDKIVKHLPKVKNFLRQDREVLVSCDEAWGALQQLLGTLEHG